MEVSIKVSLALTWMTIVMFVLRAGFLDGMPGLILAGLYAYYTFIKYAKLWELSR